ncbi:MAG TPA: DUF4863 family protein [Rhodospirillales bacterium]|nr:DUF4863 family protein [Rhodospirillales bacterium]
MNQEKFQSLMQPIMDAVKGKAIDQQLAKDLNRQFSPDSDAFKAIDIACHEAIKAGWMCEHGDEGRRFGRVIEPSTETHNLSVDVVQLKDIVGPHHSHPTGEVCMTMPVTEGAKFDGHEAGWCVNNPGSAHNPTVSNGEALVLYLLPDGQINFTK